MTQKVPDPSFVPIRRAAEILGVHVDTIRRWEREDRIRAHRTAGGHRLFSVAELSSFTKNKPLTAKEAAASLGISPSTLRRLVQTGRITPLHSSGGRPRYTQSILAAYQRRLEHGDRRAGTPLIRGGGGVPATGPAPSFPRYQESSTPFPPHPPQPLPPQTAVAAFQEPKSEAPAIHHTQPQPAVSIGSTLPPNKGGRGGSNNAFASRRLLPAAGILAAALFAVFVTTDQYVTQQRANEEIAEHEQLAAAIKGGRAVQEHTGSASRVLGIASNQLDTFFEVNVPANFNEAVYLGPTQIDGLVTLNADIEGPGRNINVG
ncbi:MAG: hypothetical protein COT71_02190, partial [Candidatus Andersenbacteria bacterium CG10_big_fil_rev_8_21_14_0_10_54_11]